RFLWSNAFGAFAVELGRVEGHIFARGVVELSDRVIQHRRLDADFSRQLIDCVGFDRRGKLIPGAEQWNRLLIVDLVRNGSRLTEHRPTRLGVRVRMARFTLVEKALT